MKKLSAFINIFLCVIFAFAVNSWAFFDNVWYLIGVIFISLAINIMAGIGCREIPGKRLKICWHGAWCLAAFYTALIAAMPVQIYLAVKNIPESRMKFVYSLIICVVIEFITFWHGIICVYLTSLQLGVRTRVLGALFGLITPVNLVFLYIIISTCLTEVWFETDKEKLNRSREKDRICRTKYPILLVHGVFFRDFKHPNYWGRIPAELERNGAVIFYGNHQSAASVEDSAAELTARIEEIVRETGCEKVNIIAHSKGGMDCRVAAANGAAEHIASLTTVNTPHRGCGFADYLLDKVPVKIQKKVENTYNRAAVMIGDTTPDFMKAVHDLTSERCKTLDKETVMPEGIYCQSTGSELRKASYGRFPLNFTYNLVKYFDGPNDGLVSEDSFQWGEKYTFLRPAKKRGISHGDVVDLNRANIPGFDVREFYVQLVSDLKKRGL